jgi:hypothetical protein
MLHIVTFERTHDQLTTHKREMHCVTDSSKVDVFAFGMILFEVLVGDSAFLRNQFANQSDMVVKVINGHRPSISPDLRTRQPEMVALAESCWATDPKARPSFEVICQGLEAHGLILQHQVSFGGTPGHVRIQNEGSVSDDGDVNTSTTKSADSEGGGSGSTISRNRDELVAARRKIRELEVELEEKALEFERKMAEKAEMYQQRLDRVTQVML